MHFIPGLKEYFKLKYNVAWIVLEFPSLRHDAIYRIAAIHDILFDVVEIIKVIDNYVDCRLVVPLNYSLHVEIVEEVPQVEAADYLAILAVVRLVSLACLLQLI